MATVLTDDQVRLLRVRAQRLVDADAGDAASVVRAVFVIQAQDQAAAALQVRVRSSSLTLANLSRARNDDRSIVRTWAMRGTLHWLPPEDVRWVVGLLSEEAIRRTRPRRAALGLDDETAERGVALLRDVLAHGPLTRDEIAAALGERGLRLEGQARPHLLYLAAFRRVICCGPDHGRKDTYVLLDDWVRPSDELPRAVALVELARRYLDAYGPATVVDFATWSGLSMPDAREGWRGIVSETAEVQTSRGLMMTLKARRETKPPASPDRRLRLLGAWDTYPLGYRDRELIVPSQYARRMNAGGGVLRPTVLVDGRAAGTWRTTRHRNKLDFIVEPFEELDESSRGGIEAEVADLGRFLGVGTSVTLT